MKASTENTLLKTLAKEILLKVLLILTLNLTEPSRTLWTSLLKMSSTQDLFKKSTSLFPLKYKEIQNLIPVRYNLLENASTITDWSQNTLRGKGTFTYI